MKKTYKVEKYFANNRKLSIFQAVLLLFFGFIVWLPMVAACIYVGMGAPQFVQDFWAESDYESTSTPDYNYYQPPQEPIDDQIERECLVECINDYGFGATVDVRPMANGDWECECTATTGEGWITEYEVTYTYE